MSFFCKLLIVMAISAFASHAQPSDRNKDFLIGQVKKYDSRSAEIIRSGNRESEKPGDSLYTIEFDKQGRKISQMETGAFGTVVYRYSYKQDGTRIKLFNPLAGDPKEGNVATVITYNKATNSISEDEYTPNSELRAVIDPRLLFKSLVYFFDPNERLTKTVELNRSGQVVKSTQYDYSESALPTGASVNNGRGWKSSYSYELDEFGNWVKRVETRVYEGRNPAERVFVEYRKISYFK